MVTSGHLSEFSLEQHNDLISTRFQCYSNILLVPAGQHSGQSICSVGFKAHSISECDPSDHPVSIVVVVVDVVVVVVVVMNFLVFGLLLSNCCKDLLQILCGCSLGEPLLSFLKSGCYPFFHGIMGNFVT